MNKRLEVVLKPWQRRRLQKIRDHPPAPAAGRRAVCLLLSADKASSKVVAQATGFSIDAITDIRRRWRHRGFGCLKDRPRGNRKSKATRVYRKELRRALSRGPLKLGYLHTVWNLARLNSHMKSVTGVSFCIDWIRKLVLAEGYVYRRPKHTLKGRRDERAFRKAQRQLAALKRGRHAPEPTLSSGIPTSPRLICIRT
jgi:transposase